MVIVTVTHGISPLSNAASRREMKDDRIGCERRYVVRRGADGELDVLRRTHDLALCRRQGATIPDE